MFTTVNGLGVSLDRSVYRAYERQESIVSIATREEAANGRIRETRKDTRQISQGMIVEAQPAGEGELV